MTLAAVALGSNLDSAFGDREANLREAIKRLESLGTVKAVSDFYDTEPVGYTEQPRFLNGALILETELPAPALLASLLAVERAMGRKRDDVVAKGPRLIDLDLLLFGDVMLVEPGLTVPHPEMANRRFVLQPLADIAGAMVHPQTRLTIAEMLANFPTAP